MVSILFLNVACAKEPKQAAENSNPFKQYYIWYDGDREQKVWLDPKIVAEFDPTQQGEDSVKNVDPGAIVMHANRKQATVRLWQMDNTDDGATRKLKTNHKPGKYSAVYHDGPNSDARMRALPGNIIIYLDPKWSKAEAGNWLGSHKLEVVKKLEIGPNIYVIKTGPGQEALDTANALYRSGEVKAAFPDWWQEVTTR